MAPFFVILPIAMIASLAMATMAGVVVELVVIALVGIVRGDAGANRFGEPPSTTWKGAFEGR